MYVAGFVIPVPANNFEEYREWAERSSTLLKELGCLEIVETWEDNVPAGDFTDFRRAVDARPDERIVFSWQIWPDKSSVETAEAVMQGDKRFEPTGSVPFDANRLIYGCFSPIHTMGRY